MDAVLVLADKTLTDSAGQVADEDLRRTLAEAIITAQKTRTTADLQITSGDTIDDAHNALLLAGDIATMIDQVTDDLTAATTVVREAQAAWQLEYALAVYDEATAQLNTSIETATTVFSSAEGTGVDQEVLQALTEEITATTTARDTPVNRTNVDAIHDATTTLTGHQATLDAATQALTDAQTAWRADQDAAAAAAAARQQRAQQKTPTNSGAKNNGAKSSSGTKTNGGGATVAVTGAGTSATTGTVATTGVATGAATSSRGTATATAGRRVRLWGTVSR
ncbi:hypothetical protein [Oerskovia sp. Root22]|uniref:hypothetical protein n=1 Tax=Oerskovia sp. Root22 TaxID=1736494 RepID=UPI0012FA0D14|nr:hypothetical protein [Oerskovia sp. Root22]